ncbi:putative leader peptide [Streptomyces xiamenensis]
MGSPEPPGHRAEPGRPAADIAPDDGRVKRAPGRHRDVLTPYRPLATFTPMRIPVRFTRRRAVDLMRVATAICR